MNTRGFTLVDGCAVVVAAGVSFSLMTVAIGQPGIPLAPAAQPAAASPKADEPEKRGANDPETLRAAKAAKAAAAQIKDSTHVRGMHQGMVMFAQNNGDRYPLPSVLDKAGKTVKEEASEKDTTSNIISILMWNGYFGPELCISPAESSDKIKVCESYQYSQPGKAVDPEQALWDPGFSADFSDGNTGNFSYAHAMPSASRLKIAWGNTFSASTPNIGNRGPKVVGVKALEDGGIEPETSGKSKTFLIHGDPGVWEGNIAYSDNHVNFETKMYHPKVVYKDAKGAEHPDVFFYNEPEDETDTNHFMGIFVRAGKTTREFKAIWD